MSFRDNLQHLRATRNMTQEQLAMLLGVSRQSVSKWEAERAYPEMDKLIRLCELFECTLDELVLGDMTARPANPAASMPPRAAPQDVTGYDQAMRTFAWRFPLGVAVIIAGAALSVLFAGVTLVPGSAYQSYSSALMLVGAAVGIALIVPALFARREFRRSHPFVEDFYTAEQKSQARKAFSTGLVAGIALAMAGLASTIVLQPFPWLAGSVPLFFAALGVFFIVHGYLVKSCCDVERYNEKSLRGMDEAQIGALGDAELASRARQAKRTYGMYALIMGLSTVVGLVLLFVPALNARWWFWLAWPIGGILCGIVKACRSMRSGE